MEEQMLAARIEQPEENEAAAITEWIEANADIRSVDFTCKSYASPVIDLTEFLCTNQTLTKVVLDARCLGDKPLANLIRIISQNTALRELKLIGSCFYDIQRAHGYGYSTEKTELHGGLVEALKKNYSITSMVFFAMAHHEKPVDFKKDDYWGHRYLDPFNAVLGRNLQFRKSQEPGVKVVVLQGLALTTTGLAYLFGKLSRQDVLKLEIRECSLEEDINFEPMLNYIRENQNLYGMNFSFTPLGPAIVQLCDALQDHQGIVELNLGETQCDDVGAKAIRKLLTAGNTDIAFLRLFNNTRIQGDGMDDIAACIGSHHKLIELDMMGCQVASDKVQIFATNLKKNASLTTLKLIFKDTASGADSPKQLVDSLRPPLRTNAKRKPSDFKPPFLFEFVARTTPLKGNKKDPIVEYNKENDEAKNKLIAAVTSGDRDQVEELLKVASIHTLDVTTKESLLHMAVKKGHRKVARLLLKKGINTKLRNKTLETALDVAKKEGKEAFFAPKPKQPQPSKPVVSSSAVSKKQETPPGELPFELASANKKAKVEEVVEEAEAVGEFLVSSNNNFQTMLCGLMDHIRDEARARKILLDIWAYIKNQPEVVAVPVFYHNKKYQNALEFAVISGHYRLMKIVLHSSRCDPNAVLKYAVETGTVQLVCRLLADSRLAVENIQAAKKLPGLRPQIVAMLDQKLKTHKSNISVGIHWVKKLSVEFGCREGNPLAIQSDGTHAELALSNNFSRKRLFEPEFEEKGTVKDYDGNPVTANLTFIVSVPSWIFGQKSQRKTITINLNFTDHHHVTTVDDGNKLERILHRVRSAPPHIFGERPKALSEAGVRALHEAEVVNDDPGFNQQFHHGEQALLDYLEQEKTIALIVNQLLEHPEFISSGKIIGVLLNIHSPRYVCENCEVGILGEQNPERSIFLNKLTERLLVVGCKLPQFSPLRMLTQVSVYTPGKQDPVFAEAHKTLFLDLRGCNNQLILSKDLFAVVEEVTQFQSNQRHV